MAEDRPFGTGKGVGCQISISDSLERTDGKWKIAFGLEEGSITDRGTTDDRPFGTKTMDDVNDKMEDGRPLRSERTTYEFLEKAPFSR